MGCISTGTGFPTTIAAISPCSNPTAIGLLFLTRGHASIPLCSMLQRQQAQGFRIGIHYFIHNHQLLVFTSENLSGTGNCHLVTNDCCALTVNSC